MATKAQVRMFCVVGPRRSGEHGDWWPDISHRYLRSLHEAGIGVRALAIGGGYLNLPQDPEWGHWQELARLFTTPMAPEFINLVCAPLGMELGTTTRLGRTDHPTFSREEILYQAGTALTDLYTADCSNLAITGSYTDSDEREHTGDREFLAEFYEQVFLPGPQSGPRLLGRGGLAQTISPLEFAATVGGLLR